MAEGKINRYWTLITIFLVVIIVVGGIVIWWKYRPAQPLEISLPPAQEFQGRVYVGGAVANPGFYPCTSQDSLAALIQAAGGPADSANLNVIELYITGSGDGQEPQKIDINRAEVWLLKALPGIGETLAQRIVDYRQHNGLFLNPGQIVNVDGIGEGTYKQIKELITVAD